MLDVLHLPRDTRADVQVFLASNSINSFQLWRKPRGVAMHYMLAMGAGGGGGTTDGTNGGGGGGSGAGGTLLIPSACIPDLLYVQVGLGGAGATPGIGGNGAAGLNTKILASPNSTDATNTLLFGSGGGGATAQFGGVSGSTVSLASVVLAGLGVYSLVSGVTGGGGSSGANDSNLQIQSFVNGGCAGCGQLTGRGSQYVPASGALISDYAPAPAIGPVNGFTLARPFYSYGGIGGYGDATAGGAGGAGGIASGGGGGGYGAVTQGAGGRGGDGIVLIISW